MNECDCVKEHFREKAKYKRIFFGFNSGYTFLWNCSKCNKQYCSYTSSKMPLNIKKGDFVDE